MVKLIIDIEVTTNGGFIVTHYKNMPTAFQKLAGIQQEKDTLGFKNIEDLAKWIEEAKKEK